MFKLVPAENKQWSLVPSVSVRECMLDLACIFPHDFSLSAVCCVLKKLPVNLAADNPIGEVLPANMYNTSKPGCIISAMFKGCPLNKQASGGGRLHCIINPPPTALVKYRGVCRLQRLGWTDSRKGCTAKQENAQSLPYFPEHIQKRTSPIFSLIHLG